VLKKKSTTLKKKEKSAVPSDTVCKCGHCGSTNVKTGTMRWDEGSQKYVEVKK